MNQKQILAQFTPRTPLFEFWLNKLCSGKNLLKLQNKCYKVSWGGKTTATQSSTISFSIIWLKEYSFTLFSEREPVLRRFLWWNSCNCWSRRCIVVKKTCGGRNFSKGRSFGDFPSNFVQPTLSNLPSASTAFQILPLDGGPQHLIHVKRC